MRRQKVVFKLHFEGGNVSNIRKIAKNHFAIEARKDKSPKPLWFYFKMENVAGKEITIDLTNAGKCLAGNWNLVCPVYSYDRKKWYRYSSRNTKYDKEKKVFSFSHSFLRKNVWVAFCYPYTYSDLKRYLRGIVKNRYARIEILGKTAERRNLHLLQLTDFSERDDRKRGIWIVARQHAGEVTGSYVLEGMIDFILSREGLSLRKKFFFNIVPMMDIDGVYHGRYGKDSAPVDFNRDWKKNPVRPEIRLIKNRIKKWAKEYRYDLFFDIHAPGPGCDFNHIYGINPSLTPPGYHKRMLRFVRIVARNTPAYFMSKDLLYPDYMGRQFKFCAGGNQYYSYGVLSFTFEFSYDKIYTGKRVTVKALKDYGKLIAKSIMIWGSRNNKDGFIFPGI